MLFRSYYDMQKVFVLQQYQVKILILCFCYMWSYMINENIYFVIQNMLTQYGDIWILRNAKAFNILFCI